MKLKKLLLVSIVLGAAQAKAEWKSESVGGLETFLYLPKARTEAPVKKALMINLHGCAQKPEDLKKDGNWETTADEYQMIVALPRVPNGGVYAGCWDYYGADHTLTNRNNGPLINLVKTLLARTELNIDPGQVYLSGLSSGGGESMVLGCMAPDLFAGIGLNAGPSTGTTANEISRPTTTLDKMLTTCRTLSGNRAESFKTQLTSIIYGNNDFIVNTAYDTNNAQIMSTVYEAKTKSTFDTKKLEGTATDGTGTLYSDNKGPRVSLIMNTNLGHNWPAGQGGNGGNFINKKSINYPAYLTKFFFENNRRSNQVKMPQLILDSIETAGSKFIFSGRLNPEVQTVKEIEVRVLSKNVEVDHFLLNQRTTGRIAGASKALTPGEYVFNITLKHSNGAADTIERRSWMGEVPGVMPPQIVNLTFESIADCLEISGQAVANGGDKLRGVHLFIDNLDAGIAEVQSTSVWTFEACGLPDGKHEFSAVAENLSGLKSYPQSYKFIIDKDAATATLQQHMESGRLHWEEYGIWYAKYGNSSFTLYLWPDKNWHDVRP